MQRWVIHRKRLLKQLRIRVTELLGTESKGMKSYQSSFESEFRHPWEAADLQDLASALAEHNLIYLADFHALAESQKGHRRVLELFKNPQDIELCVEFVEAKHQKILDSFQSGQMSEESFLESIDWHGSWGFPWENYEMILRWARDHKVPVWGINQKTSERSARTLFQRDKFAAKKIDEILRKSPGKKIVVIFGEWHLARSHLPREVKRLKAPAQDLVVFQNSDRIYWQLVDKELELTTDLVRLKKNRFVILNVPPWVKWQNYLYFLEHDERSPIRSDSDAADLVEAQLKQLCGEMGCEPPRSEYSVDSFDDDRFIAWSQKELSDPHKAYARYAFEHGESIYFPNYHRGYLARWTVNHAASLAVAVLHSQLSKQEQLELNMPKDFNILVWRIALQYAGTKILNPRRKTETLLDLRLALTQARQEGVDEEALRLALTQKMQELLSLTAGRRSREMPRARKRSSYWRAARWLGGMLGEKIHLGYRQGTLKPETLKLWMSRNVHAPTFPEFYSEVLEILESLPELVESKRDRL